MNWLRTEGVENWLHLLDRERERGVRMRKSPRCDGVPAVISAGAVAEAIRAAGVSRPKQKSELPTVVGLLVDSGVFDSASVTVLHAEGAGSSSLTIGPIDRGRRRSAVRARRRAVSGRRRSAGHLRRQRCHRRRPLAELVGPVAGVPVKASVSVHLFGREAFGSLNLYATTPRQFSDAELESAKVVAAHASNAIAHTSASDNLRRAIDSRTTIGQVQGSLMERFKLSADQASPIWRPIRRSTTRKLGLLAAEVATTGTLPDLEPAHSFLPVQRPPRNGTVDTAGGRVMGAVRVSPPTSG